MTSSPLEDAEATAVAPTSFADLGLHPALVETLSDGGYDAPTAIQARAIPPLLAGRDLVGQAQTGTGKTAAFSLPLIQRLDLNAKPAVQALVLCPTRELALQVSAAFSNYGASRRIRVLTVYGGAPIHKQIAKLERGVHVVVGTPGRIKDCIARGALSLASVRHVVLDEADEILRMGFIEDVEGILAEVPTTRQTALFSATMPPAIQRVASSYQQDPIHVTIEQRTRTVDSIDQRVLVTHGSDKLNVLERIIEAEPADAVLVFARTRASCAELVNSLERRGVAGAALHGDLSQEQREAIVSQLRAGKIQLVVATDVAARGLDVESITHVINYDPPFDPELYVHRIGRTGRAGRAGVSILLLTPKQTRVQRTIELFTGQRMTTMRVPSNAELLDARTQRLRAQVTETIASANLEPYYHVVDELLADTEADTRDIAAALARLASGERPLEITDAAPSLTRRGGAAREPLTNAVHIFVALGHHVGIRPADLVGAIANEAGVPGRSLGAIDIRDKVSFIEVSAENATIICQRMKQVNLRGRTAAFVLARPGSFERGRPKAKPKIQRQHPGFDGQFGKRNTRGMRKGRGQSPFAGGRKPRVGGPKTRTAKSSTPAAERRVEK